MTRTAPHAPSPSPLPSLSRTAAGFPADDGPVPHVPMIGAHVEVADPFAGAAARDAHVVQVNLSAPQTWRKPVARRNLADWLSWDVPVFVHSPYLVNASSIRPEQRAKSRTCLRQQVEAAAAIGARGLVVHAGHPTGDGTLSDAVAGWVEVLTDWTPQIPILIENTAGGKAGPGRTLDGLAHLWSALGDAGHLDGDRIGFCLDTCHAHAAGLRLDGLVEKITAITGRIDLVHVNDSRDELDSRRDRHANLGTGTIETAAITALVAEAFDRHRAPAVVETPGSVDDQRRDVHTLRDALS